jgi:RNA polymerase sigma-70 factor, ECF subfamily
MIDTISDLDLFELLKLEDQKAYQKLFKRYFKKLCHFVFNYVKTKEVAEEVVLDVFYKIWEKRNTLIINNFSYYIYTSVKNRALEYLKKDKIVFQDVEDLTDTIVAQQADPQQQMINTELENRLKILVDKLPEQRRIIFIMNRYNGLKYKEIAQLLELSERTIENQMARAVAQLKEMYTKKSF